METTEEERQQWAAMLQRFFQIRQPATRAEGLDTQKAKEQESKRQKRIPRLSSLDLLCALDYQLRCVCGFGLAGFLKTSEGGAPYSPHRDRVLTIASDEASSNIALVCWLQWHAQVRLVHTRDPFHRACNACQDAVKRAGLWWVVVLSTVLLLQLGPWTLGRVGVVAKVVQSPSIARCCLSCCPALRAMP